MRRRTWLTVLVIAGFAIAWGVFFLNNRPRGSSASGPPAPPPASADGRGGFATEEQPSIQRSFSADGVDWIVSTSSSVDGPCLTVSGTLRSDSNEAGSVDACGASDDGFDWGVGGLSLGGQWYTIVSGWTPLSGHVQVLLRNGTVMTDPREGSGVWVIVFPATTTDREFDIVRIQAWDGSGKLLGTIAPPNISDLRTAVAQLTQVSPSAG